MKPVVFLLCLILLSDTVSVFANQNEAKDRVSVIVTEETYFSFTPDRTGYWTFYTDPIYGRAILRMENEYSHMMAQGDPVVLHLVENAQYILHAGFWGGPGRFMLNFFHSETFEPAETAAVPQAEAHTMPPHGGRINAYGEVEISFIPAVCGLWKIYVTSSQTPFPMWLEDPFGSRIAFDNFIAITDEHSNFTVRLTGGVRYKIKTLMPMWIPLRYSVHVRQVDLTAEDFVPWLDFEHLYHEGFYIDFAAERVPLPLGEVFVYEETWFSFTPNVSGAWTFETSENFSDTSQSDPSDASQSDPSGTLRSDPLLLITDTIGSFFIADDDSGGGLNARINIYLSEGVEYIMWARFFSDTTGSYTLSAKPFEETPPVEVVPTVLTSGGHFPLENEHSRFLYTPEYTGMRAILLNSSFSYLSINDPSGTFLIESSSWDWGRVPFIFIDLAEGVEYNITVWVSADSPAYSPVISIIRESELTAERAPRPDLPKLLPLLPINE